MIYSSPSGSSGRRTPCAWWLSTATQRGRAMNADPEATHPADDVQWMAFNITTGNAVDGGDYSEIERLYARAEAAEKDVARLREILDSGVLALKERAEAAEKEVARLRARLAAFGVVEVDRDR